MTTDPRLSAARRRTRDILDGKVARVRIVDVPGRGRVVLPDAPRGSLREDLDYWGTVDALDPEDCSEIAYALGEWTTVNQEAFVVYAHGREMIYPSAEYREYISAPNRAPDEDYVRLVSLIAPE